MGLLEVLPRVDNVVQVLPNTGEGRGGRRAQDKKMRKITNGFAGLQREQLPGIGKKYERDYYGGP